MAAKLKYFLVREAHKSKTSAKICSESVRGKEIKGQIIVRHDNSKLLYDVRRNLKVKFMKEFKKIKRRNAALMANEGM